MINTLADCPSLPEIGLEVRHCPGHVGYAVSWDGRVFSCRRGHWRQMATRTDKDGYVVTTINRRGGKTQLAARVHVLVLEAFSGPRPAGMVSRHLDGNCANNCFDNLAWGTVSQNSIDRVAHGRCRLCATGPAHPQGRLTDQQVEEIVARARSGERQESIASDYGIGRRYVSQLKTQGGRTRK